MPNWYLLRNNEPHGPYTQEQIAEWVKSGQIGPQERLNREGDPNWLSLDMIPEFADLPGSKTSAPGLVGPPPAGTPYVPPTSQTYVPAGGPGPMGWVAQAWQLVTTNIGSAIVVTLPLFLPALLIAAAVGWVAYGIISVAGSSSPPEPQAILAALAAAPVAMILVLIAVLAMAPLVMGATACFWDMIQTGTLTTSRLGYGFSRFLSALGLALVAGVANGIVQAIANAVPGVGQILGTIVSFPLMALWALALFDMVATESGVIDAIGRSWQMLMRDPLNLIILGFVAWVISVVGAIACCVGILIAFPLAQTAWGCCYRDVR